MINIQTLILLISFIFSLSAFGQISEGGVPPSFNQKNVLKSTLSISNIPVNLDIKKLIREDEAVKRNDGALKIAEVLPTDIDIETTGNWTTLPDSTKIWQQTIVAEGAEGLIISYKDFYIPEGAKLFIYNDDQSQVLGAYTRSTHPQGGKFATEIISGEKITLEYVASATSKETPRLIIKEVGYIYNNQTLQTYRSTPSPPPKVNSSLPCMININCSEGDNWQNEKRGVVMYVVQHGSWYGCTGSLVNNTRRDGTPYLLTANHCFVHDIGFPEYETIIAYFNYEFPNCQNGAGTAIPATTRTLVGTDILVNAPIEETTANVTIRGSDGALLKFKENVPKEWKPYYNGWDRNDVAATSGVVIHHPNTDVKKIITYKESLVTSTYDEGDNRIKGAPNAEWRVKYDGNSVTEGGSSGAPIFNQNGLIVGTLTGGATTCSLLLLSDYYGKFGYHWDYMQGVNRQMKPYLDPINQGVTTLKAYDPNYPLGIETEKKDNTPKDIVVFPTLADNEVNVNTSSIIRSIKVYDLSGRQVYTKSGNNASTITIPVTDWQKGVYSIVVQTDTGRLSAKFIKK